MRGRGSLTARKLRFLLTSPRRGFGRGVDPSVQPTSLVQHYLLFIGRSRSLDDSFVHSPGTFLKNVCTQRTVNITECPLTCGRLTEPTHWRALITSTLASTYSSPLAAIQNLETQPEPTTGPALCRRKWCYFGTLLSDTHRSDWRPRISVSFATLPEQVKEEDDENGDDQLRSNGSSRRLPQDADTTVTEDASAVSEASPSLRTNEQQAVEEQKSDGVHVESRLDGYVARKMEINSVLGSYLDPVADKVLVGSVALSMGYAGLLHPTAAALVGLVVARDGVLVGGAFAYRAYSLRWQWRNWREFFRISVGGAGKVEPLFISKVNTVLQLGLIGVALGQPAFCMEDTYSLVPLLSWSVAGTTVISWGCYIYQYLKHPHSLAALRHIPKTQGTRKT
ncbi:hypothetical protein R1sor_021102 [Riccia sorocarpa]|uniref:Uncharacterized protein n=1 Tax=Riccia sorocarpa TaxID=122646 RepID=A0ABD3GJS1_9MARC